VECVKNNYKKNGEIFTLHVMGFNITCVVGPEAHTVFFKATDEELSQREAYKMMVPVFGPGVVFDCEPSVMYEQLKFVKTGFVVAQLKKSVPLIEKEAREFFSSWGDTGEVDLVDEMNNLTVLTASRTLLGKEVRDSPKVQKEFAKLYHDLEAGITTISFLFPNLPIPPHRKRDRARLEVCSLFSKVIKARRQLNATQKSEYEDMLQILMESQYKSGDLLTDDTITGILLALLFAGQHTSGVTSSWIGFFLATTPNYIQELLEEQQAILKEFGNEISFDSLKKSVKLENAVREGLRLFPPLPLLARVVKQQLTYKDYTIPVGDILAICPGWAMRLDSVYTNASTYDPNRFVRGEDTKQPYSYIAFGGGRHGCPGENFAILQIKTIWSVLLRSFDFEIPTGHLPDADYTSMVVGPKKPCNIRYKRKSQPLVAVQCTKKQILEREEVKRR